MCCWLCTSPPDVTDCIKTASYIFYLCKSSHLLMKYPISLQPRTFSRLRDVNLEISWQRCYGISAQITSVRTTTKWSLALRCWLQRNKQCLRSRTLLQFLSCACAAMGTLRMEFSGIYPKLLMNTVTSCLITWWAYTVDLYHLQLELPDCCWFQQDI